MATFFPDDRRGFKPMGLKSNPSEIREGSDSKPTTKPTSARAQKKTKSLNRSIDTYAERGLIQTHSKSASFTQPHLEPPFSRQNAQQAKTKEGADLSPPGFHDSEVQVRESCLDTAMLAIIRKRNKKTHTHIRIHGSQAIYGRSRRPSGFFETRDSPRQK